MLSWDALTAISTAASAIVIAATVLVGYRQIRLAGDQLQNLRQATQLDGTMQVFAELETPEFRAARLFVENDLAARMQDARFREELLLPFHGLDETEHKELLVSQTFEKIGTYARHGLLDTVLIADYCGPLIREMWQKLEACGYFALRRKNNPYSMENFEYLYDAAMDWYDNDDPPFRTSRRPPERTG
ncbi:MAG: hypothetical protein ACLQPV_05915 [Vulcanimicrobiaceae bacterium]